ncbi:HAMP domain-containing histidine kinase [Streptomyces sp. PSKA54]|uniref:histidine kinase n=1 Tax=Streptomyces himalayensis subsp. aureolus TaxID=2758039 RepID=A0A7W2CY05_9ACTN|nr:HAMP domain-containing sensor histidine kinase [Streptomyces himalayensis]MBA4861207.1 HAMP domain-containing histidine kinase [Streptomyces himalayensis subsp. aureolus]
MWRPGRPRSLRTRLVLIATVLATSAVLLCQAAGLSVLRSWLTGQVDERLTGFRPPPHVYQDIADDGRLRLPKSDDVLPSDYRVFFYDSDGRLMQDSLGRGSDSGPRLPSDSAALSLTNGEPATMQASDGNGSWRVVAGSGPDNMRAVVALPLDTVDGATTKLLWFSVLLGVIVAVGVVLLGNAAVRLGLRPLSRVERTAQHITGGELEPRVPDTDPATEVGRLGHALNTMLDRLHTALHRTEASERQLRRFMADAGHELRTPLTAIQGFAELLHDDPHMPEHRRAEAHALIASNADRMSRLVDDLFLLAKLGHAPGPHHEPVDLLSLAADSITSTAVRHPERTITLEPLRAGHADAGGQELDVIEALGDTDQLAQVVTNLLTNACTHTPCTARIHVRVGTVHTSAAAGGVDRPDRTSPTPALPPGTIASVIEVSDTGPGLTPDDARHVFDRFYRAKPGDDATNPGTGLGLAIASAIAEAHQGRVELDTGPAAGCTFRLLLPAH